MDWRNPKLNSWKLKPGNYVNATWLLNKLVWISLPHLTWQLTYFSELSLGCLFEFDFNFLCRQIWNAKGQATRDLHWFNTTLKCYVYKKRTWLGVLLGANLACYENMTTVHTLRVRRTLVELDGPHWCESGEYPNGFTGPYLINECQKLASPANNVLGTL